MKSMKPFSPELNAKIDLFKGKARPMKLGQIDFDSRLLLAPMAGICNIPYRLLMEDLGAGGTVSELISCHGINYGNQRTLEMLKIHPLERNVGIQLFGEDGESMARAAEVAESYKPKFLDINMGCPDRAVEKQGGGSALIKNPEQAIEIIKSAREGVGNAFVKRDKKKFPRIIIPVSVKTRIGYSKVDLDWVRILLEQKLPVLTLHLRTRKEMSDVPAHWEVMPEIIKMRDTISPETLIIGNGDVESIEDGLAKIEQSGCDGVMVGRGIFGKPWFFNRDVRHPAKAIRLKILLEHTKAFEKTYKGIKNFDVMKKHFKAYVSGWDGAKELRVELMNCKNAKEVASVLRVTLAPS
jgi:nifR3 family TIM-barrel protein